MTISAHTNFAITTLASPPSGTSGTALSVATGKGTLFPAVPFNATIWPQNSQPNSTNAEIVRVTAISSDDFTVTRAQESSTARTFRVGDQIAATITARTLTDVEYGAHGVINVMDPVYGAVGDGVTVEDAAVQAAVTAMQAGDRLVFPPGYTFLISTNITKSSVADLSVVAHGATIYTTDMSLTGVFTFTSCDRLTWEGGYFLGTEDDTYFQANSPSQERSFLYLNACERATVRSIRGKHKRRLMTALDSHYLTVDDYKMEGFFQDYSAGVVANGNHAPTMTIRGCDYSHISNGFGNNCGSVLLGQLSSEHVTVTGISGHDLHDNCVYCSSGYDWAISNVTSRDNNGNSVQTRGPRMTVTNVTGVGILTDYVVDMTGFGLGADADGADADGYSLVCSNVVAHGCKGAVNIGPNTGYYPRDIAVSNVVAYDSTVTGESSPVEILAHSGVVLSNINVRTTPSDLGISIAGEDASNRLDGLLISDCRVTDVTGSAASTRGGLRVVYATNVKISGCEFAAIDCGIGVRLNSVVNAIVSDNQYDGGQVVRVPSAENNSAIMVHGNRGATLSLDTAVVRAQNNVGYVNANGGTSAGITTGGTIAHGLAAVPTIWSVIPTAAATDVYVTADATNLTVTFGGGGTVAFVWEAKTASFYA